jgi:hypothetical protein
MRIPEIIRMLTELDAPVIDRAVCERIFEVGRRQANHLMRGFGGYRSGNTVLLDRLYLVSVLRQIADSPAVRCEYRRKQRLADKLDELHRYRSARSIRLPVAAGLCDRRVGDLPAGIVLEPGRLIVSFGAAEELFARLYELAQAAVTDFEGVRQRAEAGTADH